MIHGMDTGFLFAAEVREHAEHADARGTLARLLSAGDLIAMAPQVLAEFIECREVKPQHSSPATLYVVPCGAWS